MLVVATVIIFVIANALSEDHEMDLAMTMATEERIKPVGEVNVGDVAALPTPAAPADAPAGSSADTSPQSIYQSACQVCHLTGVLESPKLTDGGAWQARLSERSLSGLYQSVLQGRGNMPPKGGRVDLADDALKATVDYMLEQAGIAPQ